MPVKLETRVAALERQIARLQARQDADKSDGRGWVDDLYGTFAGDPIFAKAMNLGRQYRKSLKPGASKPNHRR